MYHIMNRLVPVVMAGAIGVGTMAARAAQPATQPASQDLQAQVNDLKAQVAQLKSQQQQQNQADVTTATQHVLAEADHDSQFLDAGAGVVGGWDPATYRFFLASDDGAFLFHPGFIMQFRYATTYRTNPHNWQDGFEVRRLKLYADGNIVSKDLTYKVQLQNSNGPSATAVGGNQTIEYAWGQYIFAHNMWGGDWGIKAGQMKNPVFHEEEAVGDNSQLMVERSLADNLIGGNETITGTGGPYIQAVDLVYTGGKNPLHTHFLFTDGDNSANTDFTNATAASPPSATVNVQKFGLAFRGDYKVMGDWADNTDFTGKNSGKHDFLAFGAGVDFSEGSTTVPAPTIGNNVVRWDIDATYLAAQKFIVYGELLGDYIDYRGPVVGPAHRLDYGAMFQAGYFVSPAIEVGGRYSVTQFDNNFRFGGRDTINELGVVANYFLGEDGSAGNHAKVVLDLNYLPNGTPGVVGLDYQAQVTNKGEFVARLLFQLWI